MDDIFPTKTVGITQKDLPFLNAELKKLDWLVKKEYNKKGKTDKYENMKACYDEKMKKAALDHLDKNVRTLKESDPGKAYATLKTMGAQPGDMLDDGSFTLISHLEDNLTNNVSLERIENHFAKISQEYPPIDINNLTSDVQLKLKGLDKVIIPKLDEMKVYQKIIKSKKTKTGVPGDLSKMLIQEFAPELATPLTRIYNNVISNRKWPTRWKVEYGIPLQKVGNPVSEDDLRIISLKGKFNNSLLDRFH